MINNIMSNLQLATSELAPAWDQLAAEYERVARKHGLLNQAWPDILSLRRYADTMRAIAGEPPKGEQPKIN